MQTLPAVHAVHVPLSQTSLVPHEVPFATFIPLSVHTGTPPGQEMVPVWHGLAGGQAAPAMHVPQTPPMQDPPGHVVPSGRLPVALHTSTPVEQSLVPVWHGLLGAQLFPATHVLHVPLSQTMMVPHDVPLPTSWLVLPHTGTPLEQPIAPTTHGLGGVPQTAPVVQAMHPPLSQTMLVPQAVPLATGWGVLLQTATPVEQPTAPTTHGFGFVLHGAPAEHELQTPPTQNLLLPHEVPSVAG